MAVASHLAKLSFVPLNRPGCFCQLPVNKILHIQTNKVSTSTRWSVVKNGSRNQSKPISIRAMASSSGSELEESVKKTVSDSPVVVYSKSWCPYSSEVKYLFKKLGVEPLVVELDELGAQGSQVQNVLEQLTGQRTVPNVFIDISMNMAEFKILAIHLHGGKHIGGCTDTMNLYDDGELESLLSDAKAKSKDN